MKCKSKWFDDDFEDEFDSFEVFNTGKRLINEYRYVVTSRDTSLPNPHYTNNYFKTARTVYGKESKDLHYDYSDRIWEWDYNKAKASVEVANQSSKTNNSVNWYEVYLSAYFDKPVELKHVLAGFNLSNGHPYYVFGYKFKEEK